MKLDLEGNDSNAATFTLIPRPLSRPAPILPSTASSLAEFPAHPIAALFPIDGDGITALAESIRTGGLLEPVTVLDGLILDGRRRQLACRMANVELRCVEFEGKDPLQFALAKNVQRRRLTSSQASLVAARVATFRLGSNQYSDDHGPPIGEAAKLLGVSPRAVSRARQVLASQNEDLIERVQSGRLTLGAACKLLDGTIAEKKRTPRATIHGGQDVAPDIPAFLDRRPLSDVQARLFDALCAALDAAAALKRELITTDELVFLRFVDFLVSLRGDTR